MSKITSKLKTDVSAWVFMVCTILGYINTVGTEYQDKLIRALQEVFPPALRPELGAALHLLAVVSGGYALFHAARSGPQTPPANPPGS